MSGTEQVLEKQHTMVFAGIINCRGQEEQCKRRRALGVKALNAEHRAENFTCSGYSTVRTAQGSRDYNCPLTNGTTVQRSQTLPEATQQVSAPGLGCSRSRRVA